MLSRISGQVERISYVSEETGFTVARLKIKGQKGLVTVVGNLPGVNPGEVLELDGEWYNHPKFGNQFKIVNYRSVVPASVFGIKKYLGSGLIRGIGPVMARRLVKRFGKDTLKVIDEEPERLQEVEGIGPKRIRMIREAWETQKDIREVMVFLQGHGVSSGYATKIYKEYGRGSIDVVRNNPYRLASDIFGIGFVTADRIAESIGIEKDAPVRAEAGILFVLSQVAEDGHVYYPYEELIKKCQDILDVEREIVLKGIAKVVDEKRIVIEDLNDDLMEFKEKHKAVYLAGYHTAEVGISERLRSLLNASSKIRPIDVEKAVRWVQSRIGMILAEKQVEAVKKAIQNKILVLTGGPGTGKTTIIRSVLEIYKTLNCKIVMGAPTGRAAKRMTEATHHEAMTIHRLLEYSFSKRGFKRDENNPLDANVVIIDEASMIDNLLMYHLLKAVPINAVLILVGDVNQLPPVGAGNVLKDIINSGAVPVVELNQIFRQAMGSLIITNAHRINQGEFPRTKPVYSSQPSDFYFIEREEPEDILATIIELVKERIPERFGLDPIDEIQVLTPMHRGVIGAGNLNATLQNILNPSSEKVVRGLRTYRVNDKVMQVTNDYEKEVFNGDIGRITSIDYETQEVVVNFDGKSVVYDYADLDELVLAYAISIHKSQGSEYPAVVIPIHTQHFILLQRNLIYTGVTRGKDLVVIVGTKKALSIGIKNDKTRRRYTRLRERLAL
nr:ATP-dependent RecD-like DNA helicase [Desulfobacterales bacterium]